jgi:hypothetical protein
MAILASSMVALVAVEHIGIMVLEMLFWDHEIDRKVFQMTPEVSRSSAVRGGQPGTLQRLPGGGADLGAGGGPFRPEGVLPALRDRRWGVRRAYRQDVDPAHAGSSDAHRAGGGICLAAGGLGCQVSDSD